MGVALPHPSGWPNLAEKILKIFIDHKLQNGEGILEKFQNLIFPKKMGVARHAPQGDPKLLKKFSKFLLIISYKMAKEFWKNSKI